MKTMRSWYCASNGKPSGPFNDDEMRELIKCKMVRRNTLVWHNVPGEAERGWVVAAGTDLFARRRDPKPLLTLERGIAALWRGFGALCRKILMALGVGLGMILILLFGMAAVGSTSEDYRAPVILLVILLIVCFVVLLYLHFKRQQDIDILNSNINKMSDDEAEWLAEKYQGK